MKKILVATDGSKHSNKAVSEARRLGEALNLGVSILNVAKDPNINPYMPINIYTMQTCSEEVKGNNEVLNAALKKFDGFKGEVDTICKLGEPADVIIEEAESGDYDLVIMGSRGQGQGVFSRAILGSITNKVLSYIEASVYVVR